MAQRNRTTFAVARQGPWNPIQQPQAQYAALGQAYINGCQNNQNAQHGWAIPIVCNTTNGVHAAYANTPDAQEREMMIENWCYLFVQYFQPMAARFNNGNFQQLLARSERVFGAELSIHTEVDRISVVARQNLLVQTPINNNNDKFRHPAYEADVFAHELVHFLAHSHHSRHTLPAVTSRNKRIVGAEEAFCDYFALSFSAPIKTGNNLNEFVDSIGNLHAYYWRNVQALEEKCEVNDAQAGRHSRRDYSMLLSGDALWRTDEHFFGKQLAFVLNKSFKSQFAPGVQHAFDLMIFDFFLDPFNARANTCVQTIMYFLSFLANDSTRNQPRYPFLWAPVVNQQHTRNSIISSVCNLLNNTTYIDGLNSGAFRNTANGLLP